MGKTLIADQILEERMRTAFAPSEESAVATVPSDPSLGLNLSYRMAAIRRIVSGRVVFTTSFTLEDQAVAHAIFSQGLAIDVLTLDSGRLFPETFDVWARTEHRYGRRILAAYPDHATAEALVRRQGINGFYRSIEARHACCAVRKAEPLRRALSDAVAWVTGLRAGQPDERVGATFAIVAPRHRVIRVNPLFDWSHEQVVAFIREHDIPYHPLHDRGFSSIGCAPCTRAIKAGEPENAELWWWEQYGEHRQREKPHALAPLPATSSSGPEATP
jgi:phosphoadenosine phosphosulfate reductase